MVEQKKVPLSNRQSCLLFYTSIHLVALFATAVIVFLNFYGVWIGKELQGSVSHDGQKLFALQLAAKALELVILTSLSHLITTMILNRLAAGRATPFSALAAGLQFQNGSYLFSQEWFALCTARFRGKATVISIVAVNVLLALTVGPASAVAMTPLLDNWPAKDVHFVVNASEDQIWPRNITGEYDSQYRDIAWTSIEQNLFSFWGHETVGGIVAAPEKVSVPGASSVRTLGVRLKGPFNVYQPLFTAVSVQMSLVADAVSSLRLPWYWSNAYGCGWATGLAMGRACSWRDISWHVRALQPVVLSKCLASQPSDVLRFPTLSLDPQGPDMAVVRIQRPSPITTNTSTLDWVGLDGPEFGQASVGVIVQTRTFTNNAATEIYTCSLTAQWAYAEVESTFIGTPYSVDGSPWDFFMQEQRSSKYRGSQVQIQPGWAAQLNTMFDRNGQQLPIFDVFLRAGQRVAGAGKIEAVLAILVAQSMASLGDSAVIQGNIRDRDLALDSIEASGQELAEEAGYQRLTLRTKIYGYAYGIRSANGVSVSSLLSVMILCCYFLIGSVFLLKKLRAQYHVNSWHKFTDLVALALHSNPGAEMENTSAGVRDTDTLHLPVVFAAHADESVVMVVGNSQKSAKIASLQRNEAYS